jgi:hypothetical protein
MSPSPQWTLFIARPGNGRQHVIRDPQGEPRIIFGEDDGTRINDRLARNIVESLSAGFDLLCCMDRIVHALNASGARIQVMRTDLGRPSSSMRFKA